MLDLRLTPIFSASPEQLFNAWTQPSLMSQWLFKGDASRIERIDIDLRPGGKFFIRETANSEVIDHYGAYLEIDRPHRLAFTLEVPSHFKGVSRVTVDFKPGTAGCEMDFQQSGVEPAIVEASWRMMFSNLARVMLER